MEISAVKLFRATFARALFVLHGLVVIWKCTDVYQNHIFWLFASMCVAIIVEGFLNLLNRQGDETRWFCMSIFLYLCSVVPPLWLLEMNLRSEQSQEITETSQPTPMPMKPINDFELGENLTNKSLGEIFTLIKEHYAKACMLKPNQSATQDDAELIVDFEDGGLKIKLPKERWITLLEQTLLVILIIGRWILPKGQISKEQLSQLLLVYLATAADIIELFEIFKEAAVLKSTNTIITVLSIWTVSLLQFSMVIAAKGRKAIMSFDHQQNYSSNILSAPFIHRQVLRSILGHLQKDEVNNATRPVWRQLVTDLNVWGIAINFVFQDGPFLAVRLYIMIVYNINSYSMIFFTCKNTLICLLLLYRLSAVIQDTNVKHNAAKVQLVQERSFIVDIFKKDYNRNGGRPSFTIGKSPENEEAVVEISSEYDNDFSDEEKLPTEEGTKNELTPLVSRVAKQTMAKPHLDPFPQPLLVEGPGDWEEDTEESPLPHPQPPHAPIASVDETQISEKSTPLSFKLSTSSTKYGMD